MHALVHRSQRPLTSQFNPDLNWFNKAHQHKVDFVFSFFFYLHYADGKTFVHFFFSTYATQCFSAAVKDLWITALSQHTSSSADSIAEKIKIALKLFSFHCGSDALINVVWCFLSSVYRLAADERIGWGWHKRWRVNGWGCVGAPNYLAVGLSQPSCGVHKSTLWLERGGNEGPLWPHTFTDIQKRTHFSEITPPLTRPLVWSSRPATVTFPQ